MEAEDEEDMAEGLMAEEIEVEGEVWTEMEMEKDASYAASLVTSRENVPMEEVEELEEVMQVEEMEEEPIVTIVVEAVTSQGTVRAARKKMTMPTGTEIDRKPARVEAGVEAEAEVRAGKKELQYRKV